MLLSYAIYVRGEFVLKCLRSALTASMILGYTWGTATRYTDIRTVTRYTDIRTTDIPLVAGTLDMEDVQAQGPSVMVISFISRRNHLM